MACPHLVPEKGEAPTDLPDDGDPNEEVEAPRLWTELGDHLKFKNDEGSRTSNHLQDVNGFVCHLSV